MEVLATASEGVMGALADKLKALLRREYDLQSGVRDDVRFLQSELPRMHAFLLDYARCQSSTALVKDWAREVQELAYDAEDAVDDFTHRVDVPAPVGIPAMVKHFLSTLMARRQIAEQLRDLRARALEVSERRKRYDLTVPFDAPSPTPELPPTSYAEMATNLVGVDGPRDEVIAKLMSDRTLTETEYASGRRVASMVGFAGVGKTTLAMSVYESLECQFQCGAFITVSRKFDDRKVLKDMLQQVIISSGGSSIPDPAMAGVETWEVRQLVGKLRDKLKD
ncbi:hypothetical protein EJB05_49860 [Eragrostis curvula]|uniref:Rx N-terminal domain-containing protein n=1 Tax=Eragrostis curvula TaxID=38414 RepID=A0A5J9T5I1_9POAL|nr:hypothetical protein EJB05_49860 [Eragrostis curvula]